MLRDQRAEGLISGKMVKMEEYFCRPYNTIHSALEVKTFSPS